MKKIGEEGMTGLEEMNLRSVHFIVWPCIRITRKFYLNWVWILASLKARSDGATTTAAAKLLVSLLVSSMRLFT